MKFKLHVHVECPECGMILLRLKNESVACMTGQCSQRGIEYQPPAIDMFRATAPSAVQAAAEPEPDVVQALFAVSLPTPGADGALPADIQWMPPGAHALNASKNGKPYQTTIQVTAQTAATVQAAFAAQLVKAQSGADDYPFLDFNHDDREAAAHPTEFYWGGDDPQTGGVRCKVTWTDAGASAVKGKSFRRFSPQFADDGKGNVIGAPVNMGGLVNRAAFKKIQALAAKDFPAANPQEDTHMKKLLSLLKKHGLIADTEIDEVDAVSQVSAKLVTIDGQTTELGTAKARVTELEGEITKAKETHAKSVVDGLVKAGAIPPKDEAVQARYVQLLIADPANEAILPRVPNKALGSAVVNAKRNETPGEDLGTDDLAEPLITKAKQISTAEKIDLADAAVRACEDDPEAYDAWRYSNGLGEEKKRKAFTSGRN